MALNRLVMPSAIALFLASAAQGQKPATVPAGDAGAYRDAALRTAAWLRALAIKTEFGLAWPAAQPGPRPNTSSSPTTQPASADSVAANLYQGTSGVALFLLELHRATGDDAYLDEARQGADHLIATLQRNIDSREFGLYTGVAGIGFALDRVFRATGDDRYRLAALRCVETLHRHATPIGDGVEWSDVTDVISGSAGIGLFLLYAAREMRHEPSLGLAERTGRRLLVLGETAPGGRRWRMDPHFERVMPNFSHGTAGVAYFLAALHEATGRREFLGAALDGGRHLLAIARRQDGGCLIQHHQGDGENLFYLGWCHGPAGTGRLFYKLWRITSDERWRDALTAGAAGIMRSGIPERRTDGFWNNVGQCCGSAGVADYMLALHAVTGERDYLSFAERLLDDVLRRATPQDGGICWPQAEHRVKPDLLAAQTGYAQGAAGVGLALLRLDAVRHGRSWTLAMPDSPW